MSKLQSRILTKTIIISSFLMTFVISYSSFAQTQKDAIDPANQYKSIDLIWGEKIPMRDGIELNVQCYSVIIRGILLLF